MLPHTIRFTWIKRLEKRQCLRGETNYWAAFLQGEAPVTDQIPKPVSGLEGPLKGASLHYSHLDTRPLPS